MPNVVTFVADLNIENNSKKRDTKYKGSLEVILALGYQGGTFPALRAEVPHNDKGSRLRLRSSVRPCRRRRWGRRLGVV